MPDIGVDCSVVQCHRGGKGWQRRTVHERASEWLVPRTASEGFPSFLYKGKGVWEAIHEVCLGN